MRRASWPKYAPGYDLFKLIVAVILTIILVALLLLDLQRKPAPVPVMITMAPSTATEAVTSLPVTFTATAGLATLTAQPSATVTATIEPATPTDQASSTAIPTTTPVVPPISTPIASPLGTSLPVPVEPIPTSDPNACPSAASRIRIGDTLHVLVRLNFRTGPGLNWPIIRTNDPGTSMRVIGGPVCTRRSGAGIPRAYLWWNVRMQNGQEGWSAEAPLISPYYFLAPIR